MLQENNRTEKYRTRLVVARNKRYDKWRLGRSVTGQLYIGILCYKLTYSGRTVSIGGLQLFLADDRWRILFVVQFEYHIEQSHFF